MRYTGLVAERTRLPHIQELCIVEMIVRSSCRIFFYELTSLIIDAGNSALESDFQDLDAFESRRSRFVDLFNSELKKISVRCMNLLFGRSEDQGHFWELKLKP